MSGNQIQLELGEHGTTTKQGTVVCLGKEFKNDTERREYFTELLREKLKDPEFRKIEGFPIGEDEDILALSDPPYYTACPNPWIADFIEEWEKQKPEKPADYVYQREPFAADVSEGKNDPIYNAHSYHTKVPHKAIMRYILHYTEPGDIVFDGFCGTGMTGVAAQMCGDRATVESLGYKVEQDGTILQKETDSTGKELWIKFSKLGARRAVLNDLSPAATFIAYNYNTPVDVKAFEIEANRILKEVEEECGWMYETLHTDGKTKGKINYTVWSDIFICPDCTQEVVFWEAAVNKEEGKVLDAFPCPHCKSELTKKSMERAWTTKYDSILKESIKQTKQLPVMINYSIEKKRYEKTPDKSDLELIDKIENSNILYWLPSDRMMEGKETRRNDKTGITNVNHFFIKRSFWILSAFRNQIPNEYNKLYWLLTAVAEGSSKLNRERPNGLPSKLSGTLYISSLVREINVIDFLKRKVDTYKKAIKVQLSNQNSIISDQSSTTSKIIPDSFIDYIFIDPPFGSNLYYSELNFVWESWLKVITDNKLEAIENSVQNKGATEYRALMTQCFKEAYKVLKPGRWMTVEFSNTKASVWNSIQTALSEAGFIVANVSALDKQQGSFKAVTTPTAVTQDLVISAYKPNGGFENRFINEAETEEGVWDFVRTHLKYVPVTKMLHENIAFVPERDPRILFDQMVAFYVRKGYSVPISSQEFQLGLMQHFAERDGMYFLPEQVVEYDRKKMLAGGKTVQQSLFVTDESSAVEWLRALLRDKPQSFQDIHPQFIKELGGWNKNEKALELSTLLEQNFICYEGKEKVPEQIHGYLSTNWKDMRNLPKDDPALVAKAKGRWYVPDPNKAGDIEKIREKALLKEFEEYKQAKKKLKLVRLEALRAGFKKCWQDHDYATIIGVADKIPSNVLEEDPKLLMWYDQAVTRHGD